MWNVLRLRDKFEKAVIKHLEDIGQKYIIPGATADLALMFVASEAIIAEITNLRKVLDKSNALRVYIVGPSTLMAAVATIRSLYNDARIAEEAEVIRTVLGKLGEDMERLDKRVNNLRSHFDAMQTDVHQISVSSGKIQKTIDRSKRLKKWRTSPLVSSTLLHNFGTLVASRLVCRSGGSSTREAFNIRAQ